MQAAVAIDQTLSRMTLALVDPISYSLIGVVVAWAAFLFCGYGLMSKRHPMSYLALVIGRLGRSVRDLHHRRFDQSFFGVFVVSNAPLVDVLKAVELAVEPGGGHR